PDSREISHQREVMTLTVMIFRSERQEHNMNQQTTQQDQTVRKPSRRIPWQHMTKRQRKKPQTD
ncbi:hypothetical protein ACV1A1_005265, partial [Escherichia coli]